MKKPIIILLTLIMLFSFCACTSESEIQKAPDRPPALSLLQKQTTLIKQGEKGESTSFARSEFENILGETVNYITVTELPESKLGALMFNGTSVTKGQTLPANSLEYLKFVPNSDCKSAFFGFTCDSATFDGRELKCELVFKDGANSPPIASDSEINAVSGITCEGNLKISEPDGDSYTVNVVAYPTDGFIDIYDDGRIVYTPKDDFSGSDRLIYTVTDRFGAVSERATLKFSVEKNDTHLVFADMQNDMNHIYAHRMCRDDVMVYKYVDGNYIFEPEKEVSKVEFLVMLMRVAQQDTDIIAVADSVITDDNGLSSGLKGYISAAAENGMIRLNNGEFAPYDPITVSDAAYMISAALGLPKINSESASANGEGAMSALISATNAGFFANAEPSRVLTKAESAKLLCLVEDYMEENNMITTSD